MTDEPESIHFRHQLGAWRLANLLASLFVIFLGLVSPYLKLHGRPPMRLPFTFGPIIPLEEPARGLVKGAALVYWALGLLCARPALRRGAGGRPALARALITGATGLLGFVIPLLAVLWTVAVTGGLTPDIPKLVTVILVLPLLSGLLGCLSLLVHATREGWYIILASVLALVVLFWSHGWLMD
jgi:hypothetical protein